MYYLLYCNPSQPTCWHHQRNTKDKHLRMTTDTKTCSERILQKDKRSSLNQTEYKFYKKIIMTALLSVLQLVYFKK